MIYSDQAPKDLETVIEKPELQKWVRDNQINNKWVSDCELSLFVVAFSLHCCLSLTPLTLPALSLSSECSHKTYIGIHLHHWGIDWNCATNMRGNVYGIHTFCSTDIAQSDCCRLLLVLVLWLFSLFDRVSSHGRCSFCWHDCRMLVELHYKMTVRRWWTTDPVFNSDCYSRNQMF